jgi:hypothetical protein
VDGTDRFREYGKGKGNVRRFYLGIAQLRSFYFTLSYEAGMYA